MALSQPCIKLAKFALEGLDCANCAEKIERALHREGFTGLKINFATKSVYIDPEQQQVIQAIISKVDPQVSLVMTAEVETSPQKRLTFNQELLTLGLAVLGYVGGFIVRYLGLAFPLGVNLIFLAVYLLVGAKVIWRALINISRGQVFDENFLMTIATFGALFVGQLPEAAGVMLFYAIGEYLQDLAVNRSRRAITALMDIRPEYANLLLNGEVQRVSPEEVTVGQAIVVKPGEKVPLDGEVVQGLSFVDTLALTGESVPRKVQKGDQVLAGMVNTGGILTLKVSKPFRESSVAKILDLVEHASTRKAPTEQFISKFSRYYTPAVVFAALGIALLPPLLNPGTSWHAWIYRALILLVISCPCALVISIPLSYFGGIGGASKRGILIKGANFLDALTKIDTVVLDKTGTITKGVFRVTKLAACNGFGEEQVLQYAAMAEIHSSHPIAKSIVAAWAEPFDLARVTNYQEIMGRGVKATVDGCRVLVGSSHLLAQEGIEHEAPSLGGTLVYVAVDHRFAGYLVIDDELKEDVPGLVKGLKQLGVKRVVMLTGDREEAAQQVAAAAGIDEYYAELLPQDKVTRLEGLQGSEGGVAFVGDGINDAPVIAKADVGIAMGGLGSDAAIEAADVVIMDDMPSKLATGLQIARTTRRIVVQNIIFALGIKAVFIGMGVFGLANMWEAVFADVGVTVLAVLNSSRALKN